MTLTVNGEKHSIPEPCTVARLLERLGLAAAPYAVEVNAQLVPKRAHAGQALRDGDAIEIVSLVGGG